MHRLLTTTAVALLLGVAPAMAIDDSKPDQSMPEASQSEDSSSALPSDPGLTPDVSEPGQPQADATQEGQLPTQPGVSPDVAKEAFEPDNGSPDTSGGAMERSSAPPDSGAASAGGGTADAQSPDIATPESEIDRGPAAAEKPDSEMESETSKE
jgi:hypothetical protein